MAALALQRTLTHKRGECKPFGGELIFWPMIITLTNVLLLIFKALVSWKRSLTWDPFQKRTPGFVFKSGHLAPLWAARSVGGKKNSSPRYIIFSCTACDLSHGSFLDKIAALNSNTLARRMSLCALIVIFFSLKRNFWGCTNYSDSTVKQTERTKLQQTQQGISYYLKSKKYIKCLKTKCIAKKLFEHPNR